MIKRITILFVSLVAIGYLYSIYCDYFWEDFRKKHHVYKIDSQKDFETDYSFKPSPDIPQDSLLTSDNVEDYNWRRQLIEPYHALWINDIELSFPNDSTIIRTARIPYIDNIYWTYPILRTYTGDFEVFRKTFNFDKESMSFVTEGQDTVQILIQDKNLIVKHIFL